MAYFLSGTHAFCLQETLATFATAEVKRGYGSTLQVSCGDAKHNGITFVYIFEYLQWLFTFLLYFILKCHEL